MPHRSLIAAAATVAAIALNSATVSAAPAPGPSPATPTGWGAQPKVLGRYHLLVTSPASRPAPSRAPGMFAFVVKLMSDLTAAVQPSTPATRPVSEGELSVFMRKVKTDEPYEGSGILSVHSSDGNYVLYLTELKSHGSARSAVVNQGAFLGPPIGRLSGHSSRPGHITITVRAQGISTLHARLARFSTSPTP
jgi:hypothetical protein